MTAIARGFYRLRKRVAAYWGLCIALACGPLLALGMFHGAEMGRGGLIELTGIAVLAVALGRAVVGELSPSRDRGVARELELGLLLLVAVYVLVAETGGLRSFLYPLVYALMSFLMVVHRHRRVAVAWIFAAIGLEVALGGPGGHWQLVAYHLTFMSFFAFGNLLVLSSLAARMRSDHGQRIRDELARMRQEARDFRLIASQLPIESRARRREEEELRMAQGAVEGIHEQLFHQVDMLRTALALNTCVLLWCEDDGDPKERRDPRLSIKELATSSEMIGERRIIDSAGILSAVLKHPKPLRLKSLGRRRIPPYYQGPEHVTDLCVIPLCEAGHLRGLLCADRRDDRPFDEGEEAMLEKAAGHIMRSIEHERVFVAVERGKYEQEQFYRASELLNQALTLDDVYQKTFAAVQAIAHYNLAVVTAYDAHAGHHRVLAVDVHQEGDDAFWTEVAERLGGLVFEDGVGLVAMAVKNRHYMPAGGDLLDPDAVVFNPRTRLHHANSVLALPLVRGEQVLGTITLAAASPLQYPAATREMLRVISHQVGVSLQNARMYQSMEERATTDGLTGLTNHRAFQERLGHLHALAERTGQKFSIILCDIDHFKSINDTYGHPVGDQVLRRVAAIFAGRSRKVDIVARYGGEEFVMVLPDTDAEGAEHFANKLREEVAQQTMTSDHGSFRVTISMGVSEFPSDGTDRQDLIERADAALYYCKEHGRNCVRRAGTL